jgi:AcrR family transcriptional regulator
MASRSGVQREQVLAAALRLADTEGLSALNMRRLASEIGVATMSLYTHFPSKEALLDSLLDVARSEVELPGDEVPDWAERIRIILTSWRRAAINHPWFPGLSTERQPSTLTALRIVEHLLAALRLAGLSDQMAALAYRSLAGYTLGYLALEYRGFFPQTEEQQAALPLQAVISNRLSNVLSIAPYLMEWDRDEEFQVGLDFLLEGLRADSSSVPRAMS